MDGTFYIARKITALDSFTDVTLFVRHIKIEAVKKQKQFHHILVNREKFSVNVVENPVSLETSISTRMASRLSCGGSQRHRALYGASMKLERKRSSVQNL